MTATGICAPSPQLSQGNEIAIVGMAGRFPGAEDVRRFWDNLCAGAESFTHFTDAELREAGVPADLIGDPRYVKAGAVLDGIEMFDAAFFGYAPMEAQIIDPQQRLFVEHAWAALEDAAYGVTDTDNRIGVFAGSAMSTYLLNNLIRHPDLVESVGQIQLALANDKDSLCTRTAYALDLAGPAFSIQSYCSTSLVAVCVACSSLLAGECDMALAGGVAITVPQRAGYLYQEGGMSSPDGRCRAFDAAAQGTPVGNGVGVVALKRLDEALRDRDHVYAVIRGWAVNNDGAAKAGYTAPGVRGQAGVVVEALAAAGLDADGIDYVEAHGTGTRLGDAAELSALARSFQASVGRAGSCAIGSVKTNVGHLDRAAGVTSLIKTALAINHGMIPASLNFETPNPAIDFDNTPFYVNTRLSPWPDSDRPRRAGVSAFGIGGTNAHVILEQAPQPQATSPGRRHQLVVVSGRDAHAADDQLKQLAELLRGEPAAGLADISYTLQVGRRAFEHRRAFVCAGRDDAMAVLAGRESGRVLPCAQVLADRRVTLLLPGAGEQYEGMAAGLYADEPTFRGTVEACAGVLRDVLRFDMAEALFGSGSPGQVPCRQSAAFVVTYALARSFMTWGVAPQAMLGHGVGEYVAACLAGVLDLDDALRLVAEWDRLAAGPLARAAVTPDLREPLTAWIRSHVSLHPPNIRCASSLAGTWLTDEQATDPRYLAEHSNASARLADAPGAVTAEPDQLLLDMGTGELFSAAFTEHQAAYNGARRPLIVHALRARGDAEEDQAVLLAALGQLWSAGVKVDWLGFSAHEQRARVSLPGYPFQRRPYWIEPPAVPPEDVPMEAGKQPPDQWFHMPVWRPRAACGGIGGIGGPCLVFADAGGLADEMLSQLAVGGVAAVRVVPGEEFAETGDGGFRLRPKEDDDYAELVRLLSERGLLPATVIHLWRVDGQRGDGASYPGSGQSLGFYSLCSLARALGEVAARQVRIAVVTDHMQTVDETEIPVPEKVTILGPCTVIPQEYPALSCRSIDIVRPAAGDVAGMKDLAAQLLGELRWQGADGQVAYRGGARLVREIERRPAVPKPSALRRHGVYLITGGLGGVGLLLAGHLARTVSARLVLTSRRGLPPREAWQALSREETDQGLRIRRVMELEASGSEVIVAAADVTDEAAMREVVEQARARFGRIDGVVHAAGLTEPDSFRPLRLLTEKMCEAHFGPKITGSLVLERVLRDVPLDFCVLQSSMSTVLGGMGFASYSAANLFLDAVAARYRGPGHWISVNWDTWQPTIKVGGAVGASMTEYSMTSDEAFEAFERVLGFPGHRVIVATGGLPLRMKQWLAPQSTATTAARTTLFPRPPLMRPPVPAESGVELRMVRIWQELLGIDQIGIQDSFFELGGNSLTGLQLINRVNKEFGTAISALTLFESSTITALSERLAIS